MVTCEHDWEWLPRPLFTVGGLGTLPNAFNVRCTRCGRHSWAHGKAPNVPAHTVTVTPTTGRS